MRQKKLRIAQVVPHMFMHMNILPGVIFSPGYLAIDLANGLSNLGHEVTLFSPGPISTKARNVVADLSLFEEELAFRKDTYLDLLKKHPLTFTTLARQVQGEIISDVYSRANKGEFDIVHIYTNEEEIAMSFAKLCNVPTLFTHHEPFNFLTKYRSSFPKYKNLNWISISDSQRKSMPLDSNFVATIYHGLDKKRFKAIKRPLNNYIAFFGRIIEPKGVHLAIQACRKAGVKLKIAGKHYAGFSKDKYWSEIVEPEIDGVNVEYVGFIDTDAKKNEFLGNAKALIIPSTWEEPFGMVMIEALACGTPVIGLNNGAIPEVIKDGETGFVVMDELVDDRLEILDYRRGVEITVDNLVNAIGRIDLIDRKKCRMDFEERFTVERMCGDYERVYSEITKHPFDSPLGKRGGLGLDSVKDSPLDQRGGSTRASRGVEINSIQ